MTDDKITYEDVVGYGSLFTSVPSLILRGMIRSNKNLVRKFESRVVSQFSNLTDEQHHKLELILKSDIADLQEVMRVAYEKTGKKQYKLLSEPKAAKFIQTNLSELKRFL